MIIPVAAVLGLLLPAALGGSLRRLGGVRLRAVLVVMTAFVGQFLVIMVFDGPVALLEGVHIGSYVAAAYALWVNRRLPGLPMLAVGAMANGVTIALNGGTLPASETALRIAGLTDDAGFVNSGVLEHPKLWFLGDIFAIPASMPLANVFSVGDVLIVAGATWASVRICGTRWTTPWAVPRRHTPLGVRVALPAAAVPGAVDVLPGTQPAAAAPDAATAPLADAAPVREPALGYDPELVREPAPGPGVAVPGEAPPTGAARSGPTPVDPSPTLASLVPRQREPRHAAPPALRIPAPRLGRRTAPRGRRALRPSSPGEVREGA